MKYLFAIVVIAALSSCSNQRKFAYFKDVPDTISHFAIMDTGYKQLVIKPDDILQVNISSPNPEANIFFVTPGANTGNVAGIATPESNNANTYLVDQEGNIDLPLVGSVLVKGLTTVQAKAAIKQKVSKYLKDPIVAVRLQNFKLTVLGEVNKPANYLVPNERISVLDAIGMAGDLTIYGKRENILIIREISGKKIFTRLNLNDSRLFQSPYYYLQQNDIVYVEPNKSKVVSSDMTTARTISIISALAGLATIIVSQIVFK